MQYPGAELFWRQILGAALQAMQLPELSVARSLVADALLAATGGLAPEPHLGFSCSLGGRLRSATVEMYEVEKVFYRDDE